MRANKKLYQIIKTIYDANTNLAYENENLKMMCDEMSLEYNCIGMTLKEANMHLRYLLVNFGVKL